MATSSNQSRKFQHHAYSTIEIITTVAALSVGVIVGLAVVQFDFLGSHSSDEPTSEEAPVVSPPAPPEASVRNPATSEQIANEMRELKQQLVAEFREQLAAQTQTAAATPHRQSAQPTAATRAAQHRAIGQRTLQYWNALNTVMEREENMRSAPMGGLTARNVRDFLGRRGKANAYASEAIRRLPTAGIDPAVVGQAAAIAAWYEQGSQVNGTANQLVKRGSESDRRGMAGENWKQAERQHNQSVAELNSRGDALRQQMIQKYGLPFPDLR